MKLKLTAMLVVVAFSVQACTSTYDLTTTPQENHPWMETQHQTYAEFLAQVEGKTVRIVTSDGSQRLGWIRRADADSVGWTDRKDSLQHVLPTSAVQSLAISHNYGFYGLLIGFLAPTVPNILGGGLNVPPAGNSSEPDYSHLNTTITEAVLGGVLGMLGGTLITHTDQYLTGTNGRADTTKARPHD